jgi:hypothetical protein
VQLRARGPASGKQSSLALLSVVRRTWGQPVAVEAALVRQDPEAVAMLLVPQRGSALAACWVGPQQLEVRRVASALLAPHPVEPGSVLVAVRPVAPVQ